MTPYDKIDDLDLSIIKHKLTLSNDEGGYEWPPEAVDDALMSYRAFLKSIITRRSKSHLDTRPLQPEPITDIVWHTHILFTEKYHQDCVHIFGEYIHHRPKT